jgi:hypothetical protein
VTTLTDPLTEATRLMVMGCSGDERAYYSGYVLGFLAAYSDHDTLTDTVTDAENSAWASPHSYRQASARFAMLGAKGADGFRSSGVLAGWKEATADRPDAEVCVLCERRILTDDLTDASLCERHGFMHDDCRRSICRAGTHPSGCYLP